LLFIIIIIIGIGQIDQPYKQAQQISIFFIALKKKQ